MSFDDLNTTLDRLEREKFSNASTGDVPMYSVNTFQRADDSGFLDMARGASGIYTLGDSFGFNADIDSTTETVWAQSAVYTVPTAAQTLNIVSTSTADTSAGTGARTVQVTGLDGNYNEQVETVTMNGTTNVLTTKSYIAVNRLVVLTAGSGFSNAGIIRATQSTSALVVRSIPALGGVSQAAIYTVPNGKAVMIKNLVLGASKTSGGTAPVVTFNVWAKVALTGVHYKVKDYILDASIQSSLPSIEFPFATPQIAGTTIEVKATSDQNNTKVTAEFLRISYDVDLLYSL